MDCEVFTPDTLIKNGSIGTTETTFVEKDGANIKDYAETFMKMLFMMRSHHMLTDVTLVVEQELFHCHKVVLSAASPYFKAMFTGGLKESEMSKIKLQGVCPTAMGRIIYFMYTGQIRVSEITVCQLLPVATMFQVQNVIDACCSFLEQQLDPTNAIGISNFAEQYGCDSLKQKANQFIERNFTQICQEEEFLQLTAIQLINLIRKDELNVQEEREVYNSVLKWVKYDEDNRYPKMEHILYAVRCQFLTPNFLKEQMKNCDVLRKVPACREYLARIFKDLTLHKRPQNVKERTPNTTRMIFIAGGYNKYSLDVLEGFNVDDKVWINLPKLTVPRSGLGAAFLKGTFYAVGGRNNSPGSSYDSDWVDKYNPITETWRPCAPMSVARNRVGVAIVDEYLYAVGGCAGSELHNTVEYFDPEEDRWTSCKPMKSKRIGLGLAVVNRLLYAIGGFDGKERLATVECYHPENNAWSILPPMKYGRSGAGVAALGQKIYVVGGFNGISQLSSVERFDTEKNVWDEVAPIKIARSALSLTVLDGKLYAMGGYDGKFSNLVEVYNPDENKWEEGTPLTSGRSGHAASVIYQPGLSGLYLQCLQEVHCKSSGSGGEAKPRGMETKPSTSNQSSNSNFSQGSSNSEHLINPESMDTCSLKFDFNRFLPKKISNSWKIMPFKIENNDNNSSILSSEIEHKEISVPNPKIPIKNCIFATKLLTCSRRNTKQLESFPGLLENRTNIDATKMKRKQSDSEYSNSCKKTSNHEYCPFTRLKIRLSGFMVSLTNSKSNKNSKKFQTNKLSNYNKANIKKGKPIDSKLNTS